MDIHTSNYGYPYQIMDIHNSIMDIHNWIVDIQIHYGYP